jgi:hypothetical protein
MLASNRSTYSPIDFLSWRETDSLRIAPKFQRRSVWSGPARSYLVDTILKGMPIPPLYLRIIQEKDGTGIIREIIDGQQRVSAVLDYIDGKYSLTKTLDSPYAGFSFDRLPVEQQKMIMQYGFICEVFHGISDQEVLEIFARMNQYSVTLNAQELRNGKYFGPFKQTAYLLGHEHLEFWRRNRIFTERRIARMLEVELTSELMIVGIDGLQDKKSSINDFYEKYDETFPMRRRVVSRFKKVIDEIDNAAEGMLKESQFRRGPLFYSLYCSVYHRIYGLPNQELPTPKKRLSFDERGKLLDAIIKLSEMIVAFREEEEIPKKYREFVNACLRQTDNLIPRQRRFENIYKEAF